MRNLCFAIVDAWKHTFTFLHARLQMPQMSTYIVHLSRSHSLVVQYLPVKHLQKYPQYMETCTQILWQLIFNWKVHTVLRLGQLVWPDLVRRHEAYCAHLWGNLWRPLTLALCGQWVQIGHTISVELLILRTIFRYTTCVYGSCLHNGGPPQWPWRAITQVTGKVSFVSILTDLGCFGSSWLGVLLSHSATKLEIYCLLFSYKWNKLMKIIVIQLEKRK